MREILFRGKTANGKWVQGSLQIEYGWRIIEGKRQIDHRICDLNNKCDNVIPETVGQYTGLTDKNGTKIFEGDILEFSDRFVVVFWHTHLGCWDSNFLKFTNTENGRDNMSPLNWGYKSKVIGNIHDNPELLKGGE